MGGHCHVPLHLPHMCSKLHKEQTANKDDPRRASEFLDLNGSGLGGCGLGRGGGGLGLASRNEFHKM